MTAPSAHSAPPAPPAAEPAAPFRWPEERPRATPPFGVAPQSPQRPWARWGKRGLLAAGIAVAALIYLMPVPAGLTPQGQAAFAIFLLATSLWVTNVVPFGVTGLLAVSLLGLSGAMRPAEAFAAFGNSAVFFLLGVFILAAALVESGLSKRCALLFLRRFEHSPGAFTYGMLLAAAFGTIWMPNQATTAMLFPIAVEVAIALKLRPLESAYAKRLFLSLAWGAMIGSNASFLGSTRAPLALGMMQQRYGESIGFVEWGIAAAPVVLLGLLAAPFLLRASLPRERVDFAAARTLVEASVAEMGPMRRQQWIVAGILVACVLAWITLSSRVDLAIIALLGAAALFATRSLDWERAERRIHWNIVLMYGGAIALGVVIDQTGAARWLVERLIGGAVIPPFAAIIAVAIGSLILSEFMSNAAAVAVMLPLAFSLGDQLGATPVALVLATSIGAGLDFALPFSSAPNTIAFASGYLRMRDVVRIGGYMTIVSLLIIVLVAWLWWPLVGVV